MIQDKATRQYAVPVRGTIWGLNYNDATERNIAQQTFAGVGLQNDFVDYFPMLAYNGATVGPNAGAASICPIRILKPHYGELVECFADISLTVAAADSDLTLKMAIGSFDSSLQKGYGRILTYTDDFINRSWQKIHGSSTPLNVSGGKISADLINLLTALPKYGDADYKQDAFVLILAFNKVPTQTGTYNFDYLNVHCAVTGAI